ncbi:hypothetical protein QYZ46_09250 [Vibrio parahaemolyticus]|nr:hypothetical protein [Vibrio parahaemolyticus]
MKKKILLGLGLTTVVVAGVGYIATKPYFDEKARIGLLADWLDTNRGDTKSWLYRYDFKVPTNSKVANWNTENVKLPQLLFTVENPEDNSKVSYWAVNIDGTNPQLLIPEGYFRRQSIEVRLITQNICHARQTVATLLSLRKIAPCCTI